MTNGKLYLILTKFCLAGILPPMSHTAGDFDVEAYERQERERELKERQR